MIVSGLSLGAFFKKGGKIGLGRLVFVLGGAQLSLNMQNTCCLNSAGLSWPEEL